MNKIQFLSRWKEVTKTHIKKRRGNKPSNQFRTKMEKYLKKTKTLVQAIFSVKNIWNMMEHKIVQYFGQILRLMIVRQRFMILK